MAQQVTPLRQVIERVEYCRDDWRSCCYCVRGGANDTTILHACAVTSIGVQAACRVKEQHNLIIAGLLMYIYTRRTASSSSRHCNKIVIFNLHQQPSVHGRTLRRATLQALLARCRHMCSGVLHFPLCVLRTRRGVGLLCVATCSTKKKLVGGRTRAVSSKALLLHFA